MIIHLQCLTGTSVASVYTEYSDCEWAAFYMFEVTLPLQPTNTKTCDTCIVPSPKPTQFLMVEFIEVFDVD